MKKLQKISALILVAALLIMIITSCSSEKVIKKVDDYLESEYPNKTFEVIDYTKRTETSGRYEVNLICENDNVEFQMYIYSNISATDSYSVEKTNAVMSELITEKLDFVYGKNFSDKFEKIQYLDIYEDKESDYKFRTVDLDEELSLENVKKIYRVEFAEGLTVSDVGSAIYDFLNMFHSYTPCKHMEATFAYTINQISYEFTADSETAFSMGKARVVNEVLKNIVTSAEKNGKFIPQPVRFSAVTEDSADPAEK